jgi:formylglycine-generating enzyme required for sulfatase activity
MKFFLLLLICFFSIPIFAKEKETKNISVVGPDSIVYHSAFITIDSLTKGGIPVPQDLQKEQKIEGFTFIQPAELVYRNLWYKKRLFFSPSWIYRFPNRILENLMLNYTVYIDDLNAIDYGPLFAPFYIKNEEVTNAEYREFVYWVRDSMARRLLAEKFPEDFLLNEMLNDGSGMRRLNWKKEFKYYDEKFMPLLSEMYFSENERYYRRKEFKVSAFSYSYGSDLKRAAVQVYPDTSVWIKNPFYLNELLMEMYFWHPDYDDYPVVSLSVPQIACYLHWKQKQLEISLRKKYRKKISVELLLPDDHEFECAQLHLQKEAVKKGEVVHLLFNKEANAILEFADVIPQDLLNSMKSGYKDSFENIHTVYSPNFYSPLFDDPNSLPKRVQNNGKPLPCLLAFTVYGNVSEWTRTRFDGVRMEMFLFYERFQESMHRRYPNLPNGLGNLRKFHKGDNLILGANMLDIRNQIKGLEIPQSYAHPDSAFATVGFRYVIRIKED